MDIFVNGQFLPASQATVSVQDRGFLYGDGLFETMRAAAGRIFWLRHHLDRLTHSAAVLNMPLPPDFPWESQIMALLQRNGLERRVAAVKIVITRGEMATLGLPETDQPTLIIFTRPYDPPSAAAYQTGWPVVSFPEPRADFLSRHKSLNYLFCLAARQYAVDRGGREGLILATDGSVAEGAATGLVWQEGEAFFTPLAASALPSVTVSVLRQALNRGGAALKTAAATLPRLFLARGVWLANSLMGLMPASSVDGQALPISSETARLNDLLWSEAG